MKIRLAISFILVCLVAAGDDSQRIPVPPPTIAFLTPIDAAPVSTDAKTLRARLEPLATWADGKWISGGAYDGSETRGFCEPKPSAEDCTRFWSDLMPQRFYGVHDTALEFMPFTLGQYQAASGMRWGLDGIVVSRTPGSDWEYLIINRRGPFPAALSVKEVNGERHILNYAQTKLREAEVALLTKRYRRDFDPALAQPPALDEAQRFKLNKRTDAVWVHYRVTYADQKMKTERPDDEIWKGEYYGVFETKGGGSRRPLWEHATIDSIGNVGTFYEFLEAVDVNGDGVSELVLKEYYYELSIYFLYELKDGQFVKVAGAGEDGL